MKEFGSRLKMSRHRKNLNISELAKLTGIHFSTISAYELGKRVPSGKILCDLSKVLNVSIDYLLGNNVFNDIESDLIDKIGLCNPDDLKRISDIVDVFLKNNI